MKILYNNYSNLSNDLTNFIKFVHPCISKPHLKLLPLISMGIITSESAVTTDIVKKIKGDFSEVQFNSII